MPVHFYFQFCFCVRVRSHFLVLWSEQWVENGSVHTCWWFWFHYAVVKAAKPRAFWTPLHFTIWKKLWGTYYRYFYIYCKNLHLTYDEATGSSMFGLYLCSDSEVVVIDDSTGFPLSGKSGTVREFCFDWNVGEFCCLAGNFFAVKCCLHF